jgi:hypothetical protein
MTSRPDEKANIIHSLALRQFHASYCGMSAAQACLEYVRLRQHYEVALRRWGQILLAKDTEIVGAAARQAAQLKQQALDERDAANQRMCVHKRSCPACRGAGG